MQNRAAVRVKPDPGKPGYKARYTLDGLKYNVRRHVIDVCFPVNVTVIHEMEGYSSLLRYEPSGCEVKPKENATHMPQMDPGHIPSTKCTLPG